MIAVDVVRAVDVRGIDRSLVITRFDRVWIGITELSTMRMVIADRTAATLLPDVFFIRQLVQPPIRGDARPRGQKHPV